MPWISSTTGSSSKMSSTRFPAAKVFCKVLPRLASATQGPKELISARVGSSTPRKSTCPAWYSPTAAKSMATSNTKMTVFVTAWLRPAVRFIRASSWERAAVRASISSRRRWPWPYCSVSNRPRRLSSTKLESSPERCRNRRPSSPLSREVTNGTTTPTTA